MSTTESRLNELRKYRFKNGAAAKNEQQKDAQSTATATTTNGSVEDNASKIKMAAGRKRIRAISDSSDDGEGIARHRIKNPNNQNGVPVIPTNSSDEADGVVRHGNKVPNKHSGSPEMLSVEQREQRLYELKVIYASTDTMLLQDELVRAKWNVNKAVDMLKLKKMNPETAVQNFQQSSHTSRSSATPHKVN